MRKRTTGLTLIAGGRGDVDDRAAFRLTHVRHCGAAAISHGAVIGGEALLAVCVTRRRAPAAVMRNDRSTRAVDENIDSAERDGRICEEGVAGRTAHRMPGKHGGARSEEHSWATQTQI